MYVFILAPLSERLMDYCFLSVSIHNRGKVYGQSNLSISIVLHRFLNVPIHCNVWSPVEAKFGLVRLKEGKSKKVVCLLKGFTNPFSWKSPLRACLLLFTEGWLFTFLFSADLFDFNVIVTVCSTASIFILLMATFFFFKVDLVLAHRKLMRHFSKPRGVIYILFCFTALSLIDLVCFSHKEQADYGISSNNVFLF